HAHFRAPLFGAFPMPPTIPGVYGQRIFNGATRHSDPCAGLHSVLKKLMGNRAPTLEDVRAEASGASDEAIDGVRTQISRLYASGKQQLGQDPWKAAVRQLRTAAAQSSRA